MGEKMKKGFTLIELLAVIIIIGVIALITVPTITGLIKSSQSEAYDKQIDIIKNAARTYMASNSTKLPKESCNLSINNIKESGFLTDKDIKNPLKPNQNICGYIIITYTSDKKYTYSFEKTDCNSESNTCG